jgi:hypothetical protein
MVRRPVDGEVHVHYGQIYVESAPDGYGPGLAEAFAGQKAGLCGAATPGALWLTTGLHTGNVGFAVEVHDQAPPLDTFWEDVVEVSFHPASARCTLMQWAGEACWDLDLEEADYRVRYCANGMDRARQEDTRMDGEPQLDTYLLQLWPAEPAPDRVVKQTAAAAAYWHDYARKLPPPPTPAERAEAEQQARLRQEQSERELRLARERWQWGGRLPSDRLRAVGGNVRGLVSFDPALVHALDAARPVVQRRVALLAAGRACEAAGLADLDWIAAALTALADGSPLPPPFDEPTTIWQTLADDPRVPHRTVGWAIPPTWPPFQTPADAIRQAPVPKPQRAPRSVGPAAAVIEQPGPPTTPQAGQGRYTVAVTVGAPDLAQRMSQSHMALPAVTGASEADPLRAALDAVHAAVATYGEDYPALLEEIRSACEDGA